MRRKNLTCHDAHGRSRCPHRSRNEHRSKGIGRRQIAGIGDGDAKDLVGHATGNKNALQQGNIRRELLCQSRAHQQIAKIGDQAHCHDFDVGCTDGNERIDAIFTCRSTRQETAHKAHPGCQPCLGSYDAQRKGHGEIPHTDGESVAHTMQKDTSGLSTHCLED